MHSIGEVVKQFEFDVPPLRDRIKGKIVRYISKDDEVTYTWSISHWYRPSAKAGSVYVPSSTTGRSLQDTEALFRSYAEAFTPEFEVAPNTYF